MAERGSLPPPGTGTVRLRARLPSGRIVAVVDAVLSEWLEETWRVRGTLATTEGPVEAREQGTEAVLLRDRQHTYRYTYATEVLAIVQTPARVRLEWQYAPGLGAAVAFEVWRQVVGDTLFVRMATIEPVAPAPTTYRYLDTELTPGVTYTYYVTARTVDGIMSPGSDTVTVAVPHALQAPRNVAAVFIEGT